MASQQQHMGTHDHHHDHGHGHHHHHAAGSIRTAFFLNLGFAVVEIAGGIMTNSSAILADAAHDLGDCFALGQAWYFERISGLKGDARYSYGYKRFSIFGALVTTVFLLVSSMFVLSQAIPRIIQPLRPDAGGMVFLALLGVAVNGFAMFRLSKERGMNTRVVALHLLEDVLGWVAVLFVSVVLLFVDLPVLDPILAVLITLYILSNVVKNLKSMVPIFLQAVPSGTDLDSVVQDIERMEHVRAVHHAHIWSLDGEHSVFSAHLEVDGEFDPGQYACLKAAIHIIVERHGLYHSTVEIEFPGEVCRNLNLPG